jgi:hypothetical protein
MCNLSAALFQNPNHDPIIDGKMEHCLQLILIAGESDMNAPEEGSEEEILVLVTKYGAKSQLWSQFWDYENLQSRHWDQL